MKKRIKKRDEGMNVKPSPAKKGVDKQRKLSPSKYANNNYNNHSMTSIMYWFGWHTTHRCF